MHAATRRRLRDPGAPRPAPDDRRHARRRRHLPRAAHDPGAARASARTSPAVPRRVAAQLHQPDGDPLPGVRRGLAAQADRRALPLRAEHDARAGRAVRRPVRGGHLHRRRRQPPGVHPALRARRRGPVPALDAAIEADPELRRRVRVRDVPAAGLLPHGVQRARRGVRAVVPAQRARRRALPAASRTSTSGAASRTSTSTSTCARALADGGRSRSSAASSTRREIVHSMVTGTPRVIYGNVPNDGLIAALPARSRRSRCRAWSTAAGLRPTIVRDYPPQLAALNRTFLNVADLTVRAALDGRRAARPPRGDARSQHRRDARPRRRSTRSSTSCSPPTPARCRPGWAVTERGRPRRRGRQPRPAAHRRRRAAVRAGRAGGRGGVRARRLGGDLRRRRWRGWSCRRRSPRRWATTTSARVTRARLAARGRRRRRAAARGEPTGLSVHLLRDGDRTILTAAARSAALDVAAACADPAGRGRAPRPSRLGVPRPAAGRARRRAARRRARGGRDGVGGHGVRSGGRVRRARTGCATPTCCCPTRRGDAAGAAATTSRRGRATLASERRDGRGQARRRRARWSPRRRGGCRRPRADGSSTRRRRRRVRRRACPRAARRARRCRRRWRSPARAGRCRCARPAASTGRRRWTRRSGGRWWRDEPRGARSGRSCSACPRTATSTSIDLRATLERLGGDGAARPPGAARAAAARAHARRRGGDQRPLRAARCATAPRACATRSSGSRAPRSPTSQDGDVGRADRRLDDHRGRPRPARTATTSRSSPTRSTSPPSSPCGPTSGSSSPAASPAPPPSSSSARSPSTSSSRSTSTSRSSASTASPPAPASPPTARSRPTRTAPCSSARATPSSSPTRPRSAAPCWPGSPAASRSAG